MRAAIALLLTLAACGGSPDPEPSPGTASPTLTIVTDDGDVTLDVEVADDDEERQVGLMNREELAPIDGMVFVWEEEVRTGFWMKDTLIPLSIAFWDERGRIIEIADMQPCHADECPSYGPGVPFVGALEVYLGFFEAPGVSVGDRVTIAGAA